MNAFFEEVVDLLFDTPVFAALIAGFFVLSTIRFLGHLLRCSPKSAKGVSDKSKVSLTKR